MTTKPYTQAVADALAKETLREHERMRWRVLAGWDLDPMEVEDAGETVQDDLLGLLDRIIE